jgi:octaprenyl-diphosphate synthase
MTQKNQIEAICLPISDQLERAEEILDESIRFTDVPLIREVAKYVIENGGKRFRTALAILSAKTCGFTGDSVAYLGAVVELIHTASLIHDDVLDDADVRRGATSANVKWGNHISVLVGDYCLGLANKILADHTNWQVLKVITDAATKTTEGEVLEVVSSNNLAMDVDAYLNIIEHKTAWLIAASCHAGAVLAEATPRLSEALKNYGLNLGMAFQIKDDILDYTMESTKLGKNKGMDLKEGKMTLPLIYALSRCADKEKEIIKESLFAPMHSNEHFESVIGILREYHCAEDALKKAEEYVRCAQAALAPFRPSLEKDSLVKFSDYVLNRRY